MGNGKADDTIPCQAALQRTRDPSASVYATGYPRLSGETWELAFIQLLTCGFLLPDTVLLRPCLWGHI